VPNKTGIDPSATWRYWEGWKSPGANWAEIDYDDSSWNEGKAGFGYGDNDDATVLSNMKGNYVTVYIRKNFNITDAAAVTDLLLQVDYDDGFVAFLNGVEVARVNVSAGQTVDSSASGGHEANGFEDFDISNFIASLVNGTNVLALEGHNAGLTSSDLTLHPALLVEGISASGPTAHMTIDLRSGNAPFSVAVSSAPSTATQGGIASASWDFGDGGPLTPGEAASHTFTNPGWYTVTLIVTDTEGAQAIDRKTVFVHATGQGPVADVDVQQQVKMGTSLAFDASGSSDPDGGDVLIFWDFGDPTSATDNFATALKPSHSYKLPGVYTARLTVIDDEGSQATQTIAITVTP
jgi:PKD repeat protein